jgi:hypothetical protein
MYGATGEKRPIFVESDAFVYNLGDPNYSRVRVVGYRENPKIGNYPSSACPYVKQYTLVG